MQFVVNGIDSKIKVPCLLLFRLVISQSNLVVSPQVQLPLMLLESRHICIFYLHLRERNGQIPRIKECP